MFYLIENNTDLEDLDQELLNHKLVAIDTEFRRTSKENIKLSLIQINNDEETFLIDALVIGECKGNCKFLSSNSVKKIFHSCREDIEALFSWNKVKIRNIYDTQLANEFLGESFSIGYQDLVSKMLGVSIDKKETRSNWIRRPLQESQLEYAATDVQFLIRIFEEQVKELEGSSKMEWLSEELEFQINKVFLKKRTEEYFGVKNSLSKEEEATISIELAKRVVRTSLRYKVNPTMLFSKKSQKDFIRNTMKKGFFKALNDMPRWRKRLLEEDLHNLLGRFS